MPRATQPRNRKPLSIPHFLETLESRTLLTSVGSPITPTLVFLSQPASTGKPTLQHFKVEVEDGAGNKLTKNLAPITLTINTETANGTLSGKLTIKPKKGIASFNDVIQTPGTYTLTATEGPTSATSDAFTVLPIIPTKLKIISVYPSNHLSIPGQLGPVVVDVLDAKGNIATNFTSGSPLSNGTSNNSNNSNASNAPTITLTLKTTLSTETTLGTITTALTITQNATAGVAVFQTSAIAVQSPGWYTLTVSAGTLRPQSMLIFIR